MVPACPPGQAEFGMARLLRLERRRPEIRPDPHHLHRYGNVELGLGPGGQGLLLAPLLLASARSELRQSAGHEGGEERHEVLARCRGRRAPSRRHSLSRRARWHQQREPAGDPRGHQGPSGLAQRALRRPDVPGRGQPMAGGRQSLFRQWRRMPHGIPLPADAAHLHGAGPGGPPPDHRYPAPDPGDPRQLPVGHLPAQS